MKTRWLYSMGALVLGAALAGCGTDEASGQGSVAFDTWGEEYIEQEIPAADFEDGWTIRYTKFLVVLGNIRVADDAGEVGAEMKGTKLFDHTAPGAKPVASFDAIAAKAWTRVGYQTPVIAADTEIADGATKDDAALMLAGKYAVYVEGTATKGAATKTFQWGFGVPTAYNECRGERDGKETDGVIVTNGGTDRVELTIHGDHLFYDDLQAENAKLRFDAIASADADSDGVITQEELAAVKLVDIPAEQGAFGTGSAGDVNDLGAFVAALSRTLGHFRGEGECFGSDPQ